VAPKEAYSRAYVRRHFRISERQLKSWEREELIPPSDTYSFSDLLAIQTLLKLRKGRIRSRQVAAALASLRQKLNGVQQPLSELRIVSDGRRIAVHVAGQKMEALSGQILLDFDAGSVAQIASFPAKKPPASRLREAEAWFQKGLELEETGAPVEQAIEAYQKVLELNAEAAGALVNLGTIYYRMRKLPEAETYYREAIDADPNYPLANFNLGNLYDEQGRLDEAFKYYRRTLELSPNYADAHFNLALLSERIGDNLKAVHHWKAYLKLDGSGQWADIAKRQLERLRQATLIHSR
jgi:tetratricopeptide (TPR) repeat protein